MQQQSAHWVVLAVALATGSMILLRNVRTGKDRRSFGQWFILLLYRFLHFLYAIIRAMDVAYLEYRRELRHMPIEIENERELGKLIKADQECTGVLVTRES